jgi:acyl-coenzyme A synthetase/AMP-(fatty) acid ligase
LWRSWFEAGVIPPGVRLAISAGAPLPVALEQAIHAERGLKIHNFYGASECGGIAYDATPDPRTDASFAGRPLVGVEVAVLESGCLQVRGDAVADGYWPDVQAGLGNGGYLTSDLAEVREGQVYLRGRAGEVIHVAGRKVAPETIERVLAGHPAVRDCLVLGLEASDVRREQIIGAVVCLGGPATDADLRSFLLRSLPAWQVPREWWFVDSLAANARGKVPRAEWRQRWRTR